MILSAFCIRSGIWQAFLRSRTTAFIETADNNTVGYAPFFVRQTALSAGSNSSSERWILRFMVVLLVDAYVVNCYYLPLWRKMLPNHRCQIFKRLRTT